MFKPFGATIYTLANSIGSTDTTITLSSFLEPVTGTPYTMALLDTDIVYATIAPRTDSSEFISFTEITQNANGTATLTGVTRGLSKKYPFTESSTYKLPHGGQSQFIISNSPQLFNKYGVLENDEEVTGQWKVPTPIDNEDIANKEYVDNLVNGGAVSTNRIVVAGIAGETIAEGNLVYFKEADGYWWKSDANDSSTIINVQLGIAQGNGTATNNISGGVLIKGVDTNNTGTGGAPAFASDTAGAISSSTGTIPRVVGQYINSNGGLYFNPEYQAIVSDYAVDSVGSDSYAITLPSAFDAYYEGMKVSFKAGTANTGACTLAVNGLSAKSIKKEVSQDLVTGDILANQVVTVIYDGTNFQMISAVLPTTIPYGALPTPTFQQTITLTNDDVITSNEDFAFGSNQTGSAMYLFNGISGSSILYRFARDSVTGMYLETHRIDPTLTLPNADNGAIIVIGSFIYVFSNNGTNIICSRFSADDLTGEQAMTVPSVACTEDVVAWTDGTDAYVISSASSTTSRRWTISGTTMSEASTATVADLSGDNRSSMWDGTNAYVVAQSGTGVTIYKLTNINGSSKTTTTKRLSNRLSDLITGAMVINVNSSAMYVGYEYANWNELNADSAIGTNLAIYPISKP